MQKLLIVLIVLSICACKSPYKRLMYGGEVIQRDFYEVINFDFSKGLPLIKVSIQGNDYTFLLDTGAPNVLSKEVAEKISYKKVTSANMGDSQGQKRKQLSVRVDNIRIGNLDFKNTGAVIIDFNKVFELSCFGFDGIIGSNLMSKAKWQIDYDKEVIAISDQVDKFVISEDAYTVPFITTNAQRTPKVKIKTDRISFNKVTFDTGAIGAFEMAMGKAKTHIDSLPGIEIEGTTSTGVYGRAQNNTNKITKIDTTQIGNLTLFDQVVEFESVGSVILGNAFLKGYKVLIDWEKYEIRLEERNGYDKRTYEGFDILPRIQDNQMKITAIVKGSKVQEQGIEIGSQILSINGKDVRYISDSLGCKYVTEKPLRSLDSLNLQILQDGKTMDLHLLRKTYISDN